MVLHAFLFCFLSFFQKFLIDEKDSAKLVVSGKEGRQGGTPERSTPKPEKKKRV